MRRSMGNMKSSIYSNVGLSTALAAVLIVVALVVGVGIGFLVAPQPATQPITITKEVTVTTTATQPITITKEVTVTTTVTQVIQRGAQLPSEIVIGALLPLTGSLASYGENSRVAIELAVKEVNEWLSQAGIPTRVKLVVEDTETKPDVALLKLQSMSAKGIRIYIGPQTSAEIRNIKGFADANKLLLISQSSTAPELAIPDDFIFRFCPDDTIQSKAIARVVENEGVKYVVPIWRGDAWGDGLKKASSEALKKLGIQVDEGIRYAPEEVEKKGFGAEVDLLAQKVSSAINQYGADKVGVMVVAFGEVVDLFVKASDYDALKQVKWFGSDGTALLNELLKEPLAAEFAVTTKFINPIFAATRSDKFKKVVDAVKAELGREPDTYALAAYDEVWVIVEAILMVGKYDAEAVKSVLPIVAQNTFGATGWIILNAAGDRATADYDFWSVQKTDGDFSWNRVGVYVAASDSINWF
ncbi:MAG: ABC transporter substrate-binding protein [Aigarchaeota archaeon]|nr:ABC transporter substrate-binding protein [Candidatus Pelearchaeum maunauluense]